MGHLNDHYSRDPQGHSGRDRVCKCLKLKSLVEREGFKSSLFTLTRMNTGDNA